MTKKVRLCDYCNVMAPKNGPCPSCGKYYFPPEPTEQKPKQKPKQKPEDKLFDMNAGMVLQSNFDFVGKAQQIGELLKSKNAQYGSAYRTSESMLKILYPNGVQPQDYVFALLLVRIWDKMCRIASPNKNLDSETPFADIAGYGILGCEVWESQRKFLLQNEKEIKERLHVSDQEFSEALAETTKI